MTSRRIPSTSETIITLGSSSGINLRVRAGKHKECVALVVLSGWGFDCSVFDVLLNELDWGGDIYLVDLPGFGINQGLQGCERRTLYRDLDRALPDDIYLLGWSLGGMLACEWARYCSLNVQGVITLASAPKFIRSDDGCGGVAGDLFNRFSESFVERPQWVLNQFAFLQSQGYDNARYWLKSIKARLNVPSLSDVEAWSSALQWLASIDNREWLSHMTQPSLHLFGEGDALVPINAAHTIRRHPFAQADILPGSGHFIVLSDVPRIVSLIKQFISQRGCARDKGSVAHCFSRAASRYDDFSRWQYDEGVALLGSIPTGCDYPTVVDMGCGSGKLSNLLFETVSCEKYLALDISQGMLVEAKKKSPQIHYCVGDMESLPIKDASVDLLFSNMALQWCENLTELFAELKRILRPGALAYLNTLGPATLRQLKDGFAHLDPYVHTNRFDSLDSVKKVIEDNGLECVQSDTRIRKNNYDHVISLMRELKGTGAKNHNVGRRRGLLTRKKLQTLNRRMKSMDDSDVIAIDYEIITVLVRA